MSAARYQGVSDRDNSSHATITFQGKQHYLGSYATPAEAACVYDEACIFLVSYQNQDQKLCMSHYVATHVGCGSCCWTSPTPSAVVATAAPSNLDRELLLCDCRNGILSIFLGPSMTWPPCFSFMISTPLLERSENWLIGAHPGTLCCKNAASCITIDSSSHHMLAQWPNVQGCCNVTRVGRHHSIVLSSH